MLPSRTLIADQPGLAVVVKLQVIFQMLLGCEIFSTLRTVEWTDILMDTFDMSLKSHFRSKAFVTMFAGKMLDFVVNTLDM